ncbi:2-hydroxyacyl-CoA dehydratase family protein [uncultured Parasutterella sp.]|uniref:2-hydroxyacyl-CoA dehydratase subunit D n=1 Tax=uncultured Parasutterella sp. TaxID=1263098 RepID=UPI0025B497F2|nr:2-hydroxyacyl-CoA dehydratase family protein [uncultured Parasutterella sp.]
MTIQSQALKALIEVGSNPYNAELQNFIRKGGKTCGFLFQETPEEIITAAGVVPVYIRGTKSEGTEMAEAYFRQLTCNYVRNTFNEILDDKWDFLDGAVFYNLCDHARRIFDNWQTLPDNKTYHFMYIPKKRSDLSKDFYRQEIKKLIEATEKHFGVEITKEKLSEAIELHNEMRRLQKEIYDLQKEEKVYLDGTELAMVMMAGVSMPRDKYSDLLRTLISDLKAQGPQIEPKVRLLYTGGHADNPKFFDLLEQQGAVVVADNDSFGTRACDVLVSEEGDPLEAIIEYYYQQKPAATRQFGTHEERLARLDQLIEDYRIDGIISSRLFMCDIWAFEQFLMRNHLQRKNFPLLELEVDYNPEGEGQIRTRVQAFVESVCDKKNI